MKRTLTILFAFSVYTSPTLVQGACTFPTGVQNSWITSWEANTLIFNSTHMTTGFDFSQGTNGKVYSCEWEDNSRYILKSTDTLSAIGLSFELWFCLEFKTISDTAYYFYTHSEIEPSFQGLRLKGSQAGTTPTTAEVCSYNASTQEFQSMLVSGTETVATTLPSELMGEFRYIYHTSTATTNCSQVETASVAGCEDQNRTHLFVNDTGCAAKPFSTSSSGLLRHLFSFTDGGYTFAILYNTDTGATSPFFCTMIETTGSTVSMSASSTVCQAGQNATSAPSGGFWMELYANRTCVPPTAEKNTDYAWLITFLVLLFADIFATVLIILVYIHCARTEKKQAREKKVLDRDEHPLGEMSIALDAPNSMDKENVFFIKPEDYVTPRKKKKVGMMNPMSESSMHLDLKDKKWGSLGTPRAPGYLSSTIDPFTEMDSGPVLPLTPQGNKSVRSAKSTRQKSFVFQDVHTPYGDMKSPVKQMNGDARHPLALTQGNLASHESALERQTLKSEKSFYRSQTSRSLKAPSEKATSIRAPSVHVPNGRAPIKKAKSLKAIEGRSTVRSVGAPSVKSRSIKVPDMAVARKAPVPKFRRSVTSTKIGSITQRRGAPAPRKALMPKRSKTMVIKSGVIEDEDATRGGVANFLEGETNWGATSDAGLSARTARTNRTTRTTRTTRSKNTATTPRKSILKKSSRFSSDFLPDDVFTQTDRSHTHPSSPANHSLQQQYDDMLRRNDPLSNFRKVGATRKPWH